MKSFPFGGPFGGFFPFGGMHRRWPLVFSSFTMAVALGGCLASRVLTRDEPLPYNSTEGYFIFAVDGPPPTTVAINMCQDGNVQNCFTAGPLQAQGDLAVIAAPAARYCLTQILIETGATSLDMQLERKHMECFAINVAAATYVGHLKVEVAPTEFSTSRVGFGWQPHDDIREVISDRYPHVANLELLTPVLTSAGPDPLMRGFGAP